MTKILVVDDESSIVKLVSAYLEPEGYQVYTAADGPSGLKAARAYKPDVLLLDVMLPGMDGIELLSRLRRESDMYVILLTARTEETDKIVGLSVGADDYVTKPFSPRELVARVKAMLRRPRSAAAPGSAAGPDAAAPPRRFGDLVVDESRHEVTRRGAPVPLTVREFALLAA